MRDAKPFPTETPAQRQYVAEVAVQVVAEMPRLAREFGDKELRVEVARLTRLVERMPFLEARDEADRVTLAQVVPLRDAMMAELARRSLTC